MIRQKTVFVLGAGASVPFGFPTGSGLSDEIARELYPGHNHFDFLRQHAKFSTDEIGNFRNQFRFSGNNSIDAFLEHRPDLIAIGKAVIATFLIPCEQPENLFVQKDNWLRYLYNNVKTTFDAFDANQMSFITFNYDRSVEHFLHSSLKHSFGKSDEECAKVLSAIPIVHLHGKLGEMPWQSDTKSRPYDSNISPEAISMAAKSIKIIHEKVDPNDRDFLRARQFLQHADEIFCLGFGYHPENCERLRFRDLTKKAKGTCKEMRDREKTAASSACGGNILLRDADCLTFLQDVAEL